MTDPIWSERASPFSFAGPLRMRPPGIRFEDLPKIDLVLLSHNHYDHFDRPTLRRLIEIHNPHFIVPLGVKNLINKTGATFVSELDWWETLNFKLNIQCVPAQHFSARGMFDRERTLWCGYLLQHPDATVYFAGDSGYGPFFREIGERTGNIDVAILPIGAYKPRWFMSPVHMEPEDAVRIHREIEASLSIAMHFGTFPLGDDGQGVAEKELRSALDKLGVPASEFLIPEEGMPIKI